MPNGDPIAHARLMIIAARRLVIFTGAGVSADSGIPTFRGSEADSFWGQYSPEELATPEGFAANPKLVYDWYTWRRSQLAQIQPNPAHRAIAQWQEKKQAVVITQNIDGLHERVAPQNARIWRLHGTLADDRCSGCQYREAVNFSALPALRPCPRCKRYMRPDVVWFGETLDPEIWKAAELASTRADVFVVVGTSGTVHPAVDLVHVAVSNHADIIVINPQPSPLDELAHVRISGKAAEVMPQLL